MNDINIEICSRCKIKSDILFPIIVDVLKIESGTINKCKIYVCVKCLFYDE